MYVESLLFRTYNLESGRRYPQKRVFEEITSVKHTFPWNVFSQFELTMINVTHQSIRVPSIFPKTQELNLR